jgi:cytochrome P450
MSEAAAAPLGPDDDVEYDPFSYETDCDPYPVYRWMRDFAPAYHNERLGFWALTRFQDNLEAFLDPVTYSSSWGTSLEFMDGPKDATGLMIYMDAPRHTRYRKLVSGAFTLGRVRALEPLVRELTARHLDALVGRPRFDVVREFSARLPMDVISTLLGIPEADRADVQRKSNQMLHREPGDPNPTPEAVHAALELIPYWNDLIAERRRGPKDDLLSALVEVEVPDDDGVPQRLTDEEIRAFLVLLATAGNETVTKLLATAFLELARHPDQRRTLVAEPRWIANAVEETLRFDPPSQYQGRITTREVTWHGVRIPRHGRVILLNGATGRDERRFADPDRFDVRRTVDLHLGFGYGRHFCLGASLARLESRIGIEEFLRRWPDYEAPADGVERMHSSNVRGLSGLAIEPAPTGTRSHPKG